MGYVFAGIIVFHVAVMVVIDIAACGKQEDEYDYFAGGGGIPHWLQAMIVGLSIEATFFSGISLFVYPRVAYNPGVLIFGSVIMVPLAAWLAYQYLLSPFFSAHGTGRSKLSKETREEIDRLFDQLSFALESP